MIYLQRLYLKFKKQTSRRDNMKIKNNRDRANRIKKMLGLNGNDDNNEYYRVADVICDLMHYCNYYKYFEPDDDLIDFDHEYNMALRFYDWEVENDTTR